MMDKNKILLAVKNEEDIKMFSGYLSGIGFDVTPVKDGARALELAVQEAPTLIVADTELPVIGGERIFQILRHNPNTSKIPFLFISNIVADIKGFRTGIDILLLRPVNLEELYGRIRQSLSNAAGNISSKDIEGKLSHMSLADILQLLHLNKKEGELRITSGEKTGSVYIKDGEIYNSAIEGIEKEKALFRLLQWNEGRFEFIPKPVSVTKKIRSTTGNLLMEGMRQIDEFKKKQEQFPYKKKLLKAKIDPGALPKGLQPVIYEIMQLVQVYPRVEDIVDRSTHPDYETYSALVSMIGRGILEEIPVKDDEKGAIEQFLTHDQAISIREKILNSYTDYNSNYGKILILSTSGALVAEFINGCRRIPGFFVNGKSPLSQISMENPLGEVATIKLYGGIDILLFSIPTVKDMGPLWRAFSTNLIGLFLLWDDPGEEGIKELAGAKRDILSARRVPVLHIYAGGNALPSDGAYFKKAFSFKLDEPLFRLNSGDGNMVFEVFYALFANLIKEDYAR